MAEALAYDLDGNACLGTQTRVGIAKTVQRDRRDTSPLDAVEHRPTEVPRVIRGAIGSGEH